jgi:hypothetical protein
MVGYLNPKLNLGIDGAVDAKTGWGSGVIDRGLIAMGVAGGGGRSEDEAAGFCAWSNSSDVSSRRWRRYAIRNSYIEVLLMDDWVCIGWMHALQDCVSRIQAERRYSAACLRPALMSQLACLLRVGRRDPS